MTIQGGLLMLMVGVSLAQSKKQPNVRTDAAIPSLRLEIVETVTLPTEIASAFGGLECDNDGNFYLITDLDGEAGIRKLNKKGELLALSRASTATDPKIEVAMNFSVGLDGTVYQVAFPHSRVRYVLAFGKDGVVKSEIKLDTSFGWVPSQVTPFASGNLLITGLKYDPAGADLPRLPFTGIFSSSGILLKEIALEDDKSIHDMAVSGDEHVVPMGSSPLSNSAVEHGALEAASDGNIYLMRNLSPAIVYAISPGGAVIKRFTVDPGKEHYRPYFMHIAGRKIAILFREAQTHEQFVRIVDLDGHEIGTYNDTVTNGRSHLGLAFACYTDNPERLTFLGVSDDHRLQYKIAEPR
jgi:hypothetical protein